MTGAAGGPRSGASEVAVAGLGHNGGLFATMLSGVALLLSGLSYYESSLKAPSLEVFVPPMIHYARDGDNDVFNIPITIANDGARSGTVLGMELEVENLRPDAEAQKKRFHSIYIGDYPKSDDQLSRSFAPLSIGGNATFSETVRFYPSGAALPFVVDDAGEYRFTLKLHTAKPSEPGLIEGLWRADPKPLTFTLTLPFLSVQHLTFRHGTVAMFNKDWRTAVSEPEKSRPASPDASGPAPAPPAGKP